MPSVKGKLFEHFVYNLLLTCGFWPVTKDGLLIYDGTAGTMIQGLGQPHNADVLLAPPVQTPFYFPTRLLVECKCYDEPIGLPIIRNALGLREDINSFDIVTEEILRNRKSSRTTGITCYPIMRYQYQVGVASMSGFKSTAFPFAQAHRIPLISFSSTLFSGVRRSIELIEECAMRDERFAKQLLESLKRQQEEGYIDTYFYEKIEGEAYAFVREFTQELLRFQKQITIGLLEDGTILFLMKEREDMEQGKANRYEGPYEEEDENPYKDRYENQYGYTDGYTDGYALHWNNQSDIWSLEDGREHYHFELPRTLYEKWIAFSEEQRSAALQLKRDYLSKIVLFGNRKDRKSRDNIRVIHLSERFMEEAGRKLKKQGSNQTELE